MDVPLLKDYFSNEEEDLSPPESDTDTIVESSGDDDDAPPPPMRKPPRPPPPRIEEEEYELLPAESIASDDDDDTPPMHKPPRPPPPRIHPPRPPQPQLLGDSPLRVVFEQVMLQSGIRPNYAGGALFLRATEKQAWDEFVDKLGERFALMEACMPQLKSSKTLKILLEDKKRLGNGLAAWKKACRINAPLLEKIVRDIVKGYKYPPYQSTI